MAKAVGLDLGGREAKVIELEGSYRKPRLLRYDIEKMTADEGGRAKALAKIKKYGGDEMSLSFPSCEAVMRSLTIPFTGIENIRKVIKFEVEGAIHSHNVDDMVVDFRILDESKDETKVLVAAAPKPQVKELLSELEGIGVEPHTLDLDTIALFRAAHWCGAFEVRTDKNLADAPPTADNAALETAQATPTSLVIDIGSRATKVLVVRDGELVDTRTLRAGTQTVAEHVAQQTGSSPDRVHDLMTEGLLTGDDASAEMENETIPDEEDAAEIVPSEQEHIPHDAIAQARNTFLERLSRELRRFLSSLREIDQIEKVWTAGSGSALTGIEEIFREIFDCDVEPLDVMSGLSHKLDPDEAAALSPRMAVAIGLAIGRLGGEPGFNFRQEDLVYTRGFDRIKFPLTLACMLALFLIVIFDLKTYRELKALEQQYGATAKIEEQQVRGRSEPTLKAVFYGHLGYLMNRNGWFDSPANFIDRRSHRKQYDTLVNKVVNTPVFQRMNVVKNALRNEFTQLQRAIKYYPELRVGSGYGVLVEMAEVLDSISGQLGRYLVTEIDLKVPPRDRGRYLRFVIILRSDDSMTFRSRFALLKERFATVAQSPDSAFLGLDKGNPEKPFTDSEGHGGAEYDVKLLLKLEKNFPVFPKGG